MVEPVLVDEMPRHFDSKWFRRVVKRHVVLKHPLLNAARNLKLSRRELKEFALQEAFVSLSFPAMMAEVVARIPYTREEVRYPLITNMYEEVGEQDLSQSHPSLLRGLARALGASETEITASQPLPKTKAYLDQLFGICRGESFLRSLGAIGYGNEFLVLFEYPPFRKATQATGCADSVLRFFDVNIVADASHTANLERTLEVACASDHDVRAVFDGMLESLAARVMFYDGLWEKILADRAC